MKIQYEYRFGLPGAMVWKYIKDETILRNSLPECRSFAEKPGGIYMAEVEMGVGPLKDLVILEVTRVDEKSPSYYHLSVKGKGKLGEVNGEAEMHIRDQRGNSIVTVSAEVEVTGKASFIVKRMLEGGNHKTIEKFFETVELEMKKHVHKMKRGSR